MAEKRLYHVAFIVSSGNKLCTVDSNFNEVKDYAQQLSHGWSSHAKSHYEWIMPNGVAIGVERQEHRSNAELKSVSVFEKEEIPVERDIRELSLDELAILGYKDYGDFVDMFIKTHDPEAYAHIVKTLFNSEDQTLIGSIRKEMEAYIRHRPFVYYSIEWYESQAKEE